MTVRRGMGRFAADLPEVDEFVSLGEADTPLLGLDVLAARLQLPRLWAKDETGNRTGSYKDRIAAMSVSLARQQGKAGWIATSSGNAGAAMAAYGVRAGLPGLLCLVGSAPMEKLLPLLPYGIGVLSVQGAGRHSTTTGDTGLLEQVCSAAERHNLYVAITAHRYNPAGMRGADTIGYELAEQVDSITHVYVPVGGGGLLAAIARGLENRGLSCRLIACQPAGCAPVVRFLNGQLPIPEIERCDSGISALQLPAPPDGQLAADAVAGSHGWGVAPSDDDILAAQRLLAETEGIFVEPAAAAGLAALLSDREQGRLDDDAEPVLVLTGAGWKDLTRFAADADLLPRVELGELETGIDKWATASLGGSDPRERRGQK